MNTQNDKKRLDEEKKLQKFLKWLSLNALEAGVVNPELF